MSNSVSHELANVKNLINEGKYENALQLVNDIEQKENLNHEETLRTQAYKSRIYIDLFLILFIAGLVLSILSNFFKFLNSSTTSNLT